MGDSSSSQSNYNDLTEKLTLDAPGAEETAARQQIGGLGANQAMALNNELMRLNSGASPFALTPNDQVTFNTAWDSAQNRLMSQGKDYADFLSGSRGLRMSDTPVSQQAMDRLGLGLADLHGSRALSQLDFGLRGNQARTSTAMGLGSVVPGGSVFNAGNLFQERLATGTKTTKGYGYASGTAQPSGLQTGAQIAGGVGGMMAGAAAMAPLFAASDRRLKRNIKRIGTHDGLGLGIYQYDIGDRHEVGVMAQEVEKKLPDAVHEHPAGFKMVDYGKL
jgi:hypothetical protein